MSGIRRITSILLVAGIALIVGPRSPSVLAQTPDVPPEVDGAVAASGTARVCPRSLARQRQMAWTSYWPILRWPP